MRRRNDFRAAALGHHSIARIMDFVSYIESHTDGKNPCGRHTHTYTPLTWRS